jgi:hypothetical protein
MGQSGTCKRLRGRTVGVQARRWSWLGCDWGEFGEAGRGGPREKALRTRYGEADEHERDGPCNIWGSMALARSIKRSSADPRPQIIIMQRTNPGKAGKNKYTDATNERFLCLFRLRRLTTCASYIPQSVFSLYVQCFFQRQSALRSATI